MHSSLEGNDWRALFCAMSETGQGSLSVTAPQTPHASDCGNISDKRSESDTVSDQNFCRSCFVFLFHSIDIPANEFAPVQNTSSDVTIATRCNFATSEHSQRFSGMHVHAVERRTLKARSTYGQKLFQRGAAALLESGDSAKASEHGAIPLTATCKRLWRNRLRSASTTSGKRRAFRSR